MSDFSSRRTMLLRLGGLALCGACRPVTSKAAQPSGDDFGSTGNAGPAMAVSVTVRNTAIGRVSDYFVGLSYEKNKVNAGFFAPEHAGLLGSLNALGPGILRLGGAAVEMTSWMASGPGRVKGQTSPADVDQLAGFLSRTNWKVIYGLPFIDTDPSASAAEAAYAAKVLRPYLIGFEFGNEPDFYSRRPGHADWNVERLIAKWQQTATAVQRASGGAPLAGPATASIKNVGSWLTPFVKAAGSRLNLITQHYYRAAADSPVANMAGMLSPDPTLMRGLQALLEISTQQQIPYRIGESNSFYGVQGAGVWNTFGSAIWAIDYMFQVAVHGGIGVNFHGGGYGPSYSPIVDDGRDAVGVHPIFAGLEFFSLAGNGTLLDTQVDGGNGNVSCYAVDSSSGRVLMILNKDTLRGVDLSVRNARPMSQARVVRMTAPNADADKDVRVQGQPIGVNGAFGSVAGSDAPVLDRTATVKLGAASAALVHLI